MPNDPLRDSSARQDREDDVSGYTERVEVPMQRRREREAPRAAKAAVTKLFVLDTNVLLHDPTSLFRFEEHDVFIPMTVLEELDEKKKGASEVSRNGRQVSRFLNELIELGKQHDLGDGLELSNPQGIKLKRGASVGRLYFQHRTSSNGHAKADNQILSAVIELRDQNPGRDAVSYTHLRAHETPEHLV